MTVLKGKIKLLMILSTAIMMTGNASIAAARLDNLAGVYAAVSIACLGVGAVIVPCQIVSTIVSSPDPPTCFRLTDALQRFVQMISSLPLPP